MAGGRRSYAALWLVMGILSTRTVHFRHHRRVVLLRVQFAGTASGHFASRTRLHRNVAGHFGGNDKGFQCRIPTSITFFHRAILNLCVCREKLRRRSQNSCFLCHSGRCYSCITAVSGLFTFSLHLHRSLWMRLDTKLKCSNKERFAGNKCVIFSRCWNSTWPIRDFSPVCHI